MIMRQRCTSAWSYKSVSDAVKRLLPMLSRTENRTLEFLQSPTYRLHLFLWVQPNAITATKDGVLENCPWPWGQLEDKKSWPWPWKGLALALASAQLLNELTSLEATLKRCWLFPVLTVTTGLEVTSLKHWNYVCPNISWFVRFE